MDGRMYARMHTRAAEGYCCVVLAATAAAAATHSGEAGETAAATNNASYADVVIKHTSFNISYWCSVRTQVYIIRTYLITVGVLVVFVSYSAECGGFVATDGFHVNNCQAASKMHMSFSIHPFHLLVTLARS